MNAGATICFKNVSFRYREDLPWVLRNLNIEIKPFERLGIVGKTGSGKSSFIQTLFYLYPVTEGHIYINGKRPYLDSEEPVQDCHMNLSDYRKLFTLIPQDPVLFRGTLRENLSFNQPLPDRELLESLNRVGLLEWYETLPPGLNYTIEERGKNLSQGERQLLCMARCLLQKTPVVIMDEATASVDPQSEQIMMQASQNFFTQRTQLIIAHRLSTLEHCDRILWLHQGEIKALGPPSEVLSRFIQTHKNEVIF